MPLQLLGLRTMGIKVTDLQAAKQWYTNVLGIAPYFDEPFYVGFEVAGYELGLQPVDATETCNNREQTTTYWGVSDVQASYDMLLAAGAGALEPPTEVGGNIVVAAVTDPWGNPFGIIYNPHFKLPA